MNVSVTKRDAYEIVVGGKPVLFTVHDKWNGLSLLRDSQGRSVIACVDRTSLFSASFNDIFGDVFRAEGSAKAMSIDIVSSSVDLHGLLEENKMTAGADRKSSD